MKEISIVVLIGLTFISVSVYLVYVFNNHRCTGIGEMMGVEYRYSILTECMIKVDGRWVPLSAYKVVK